jgi:channel protein (hemolysin III family)
MDHIKIMKLKEGKPLLRDKIYYVFLFCVFFIFPFYISKFSGKDFFYQSIFIFSLVIFLCISIIYHNFSYNDDDDFDEEEFNYYRLLDHLFILVLMMGCFTPVIGKYYGIKHLLFLWLFTLIGMYGIYKRKNYKSLKTIIIYIILGLLFLPYLYKSRSKFTTKETNIFYFILVLKVFELYIYKAEKPNLIRNYFEFHELLHLISIVTFSLIIYINYNI